MAEERTLGQLVAEASRDLSEIVRHEIALGKAELKGEAAKGAVVGGMFGAAGYLAAAAGLLLFFAAAFALEEAGLVMWAAFLIVAAVLFGIAGILVLVGRSRAKKITGPEQTIRSVQETIAAVRPTPKQPAAMLVAAPPAGPTPAVTTPALPAVAPPAPPTPPV